MAENLLTDARLRTASIERDGSYLPDGGGLRFRLLPPSRNHARGAALAYYSFKLKRPDGSYLSTAHYLGTIGDSFTDDTGKTRPFALADARAKRNKARDLVAQGIDPRDAGRLAAHEKAEAHRKRLADLDGRRTFRAAFDRWLELYLAAHRKDGGRFVQAAFERHVLPSIGDETLATLQRARIADLLDALVSQGKRRMANVVFTDMRQFFRWSLARDWLATDPSLGLTKKSLGGEEKPRSRSLSTLEIIELRDKLPAAALPARIIHALWLILATGCRVGEISAAKASDFADGVWTIPETKSGRTHVIHLSDFATRHLDALLALRGDSEYLLPGRSAGQPIGDKVIAKMVGDRQRTKPLKGRSKASAALILARGPWTPHDLRRTMATLMRERLKVSSDVVEKCLNHVADGIVGTYQVGELLEERKVAFEAWGAELTRQMAVDVSNVTALTQAPYPKRARA